ncbi:quinol:cytochrome C oxidoreductase [Christiangramia fulva]|uniref:Quinol:cytochrome C oxidoreductase n=1 Tax=Christiangramia fulva TaxID=2126553 RepID=A0A2R3Z4Z3_9FLAO|nr:quinol:cytochrome C oxidoreductase [Christiangramia fulva]AVR45304.1 quinol:cytochrome C oxidoreductase [Christiangramia fulva]
MYTLPSKLKITAIILMVVGLIGLVIGFLDAPDNVEEVKEMMAAQSHHGEEAEHDEATANMNEEGYIETAGRGIKGSDATQEVDHPVAGEGAHEADSEAHYEHLLHQLQTKPWSALFVSAFFFFMIALGALVFYAIQYAAQAGWSPVLFRVIEGITAYLLPGSIIVFLIVIFAGTHFFPWQNEELVAEDKILQLKSGYLNFPFFLIRAIIYVLGWNLYRFFARKYSDRQEEVAANDYRPYRKLFKASVGFLVFFIITESLMSWDWFMSMTPHWYSTLFAWYIFASLFVSAITVIAMVTVYLKKGGYIPFVNDSHLHDLAKFMFAFSIFWTYLWFGQFMLIWYANIPEEVTYFTMRIENYNLLFFGMLILNFVFPILLLMNSDYKRVPLFVLIAGTIILIGHYIDIFLLVMPSTVGPNWYFGLPEFGGLLFFLGLFIIVVGSGLGKLKLLPKNNPFLKESEHYHY